MLNGNGNAGSPLDALEAALLEALAPLLVDALVIHDGDMVAICPVSPAAERKLAALCRSENGKAGNVLPPGLALVTSPDRAAATVALLVQKGYSLDIACKDAGDAAAIKTAIEAVADASKSYVSEVREPNAKVPKPDSGEFRRPYGAGGFNPRNN
jgi:hypothetical protein